MNLVMCKHTAAAVPATAAAAAESATAAAAAKHVSNNKYSVLAVDARNSKNTVFAVQQGSIVSTVL